MGVQVDEHTIAAGHGGDGGIDPLVVRPGERRRQAGEVEPIVTEGRVVDVADEDRADGRSRT
jgi:hypothetical protein